MLTRRFLLITGYVVSAFAYSVAGNFAWAQTQLTASQVIEYLKTRSPTEPIDFSFSNTLETAGGQGSGGTAAGPDAAKLTVTNTAPPGAKLPSGAEAIGGTGGADASAISSSSWVKVALYALGGLLILAGVALWIIPKISPALLPVPVPAIVPLGLVGAGAALIVAAIIGGALTIGICAAVAIVVLAGPKLVHAFQASQAQARANAQQAADAATIKAQRQGLAAMVSGVALLPAPVKTVVAGKISEQADPTTNDRATIHAAAAAQGVDLHIPENPTPAAGA